MTARTALLATLWMAAGCTFTGLGRYDVPRCDAAEVPASLDQDPCNELNAKPSGCIAYQCDIVMGRCVERVLDFDRDGDPAPACGGTDCDDRDPKRRGGRTETCDGVDNDCDGLADEDLVMPLMTRSILALPAAFRDASISQDNGRELAGAAVVAAGADSCILALTAAGAAIAPPCTFPSRAGLSPHQPWVRPIVAEDLTFGAVFVTTSATCTQGQLAFRSTKGGGVDGPCVGSGASVPSFLPYPDGKAILAAYLGGPPSDGSDPTQDCKARTAAPLDAVWIDRPTASSADPQPRVYSQRLALGSSLSMRPPALVTLGEAILLAAPADGAVGVWSMRAPLPDGSGQSVVPLVLPTSLDALADARSVGVALADVEGGKRLAIVAELGCPPTPRIVMVLAQLTEPGPVATIVRAVDVVSEADRATGPEIAWLDSRKEWWVSWTGEDTPAGALHVRRFAPDGEPTGAPVITAPGAKLAVPKADYASVPSAGAIAWIGARGFGEALFGCP